MSSTVLIVTRATRLFTVIPSAAIKSTVTCSVNTSSGPWTQIITLIPRVTRITHAGVRHSIIGPTLTMVLTRIAEVTCWACAVWRYRGDGCRACSLVVTVARTRCNMASVAAPSRATTTCPGGRVTCAVIGAVVAVTGATGLLAEIAAPTVESAVTRAVNARSAARAENVALGAGVTRITATQPVTWWQSHWGS